MLSKRDYGTQSILLPGQKVSGFLILHNPVALCGCLNHRPEAEETANHD